MQAIILAAGIGKRLQPFTKSIPKCMIKIKNKPLIFRALDCLSDTGKIKEVIIVCGYKSDIIQKSIGTLYKGMKIYYIINEKYEKTNNVFSLYMVGNMIKEDCLLLECDLFYQRDVIDAIIDGKADCDILVSPFNKITMDGTIVIEKDGKAMELLIKAHQDPNKDYKSAYKTVNIYRFEKNFFNKKLMPALKNYVETGNLQSYYELVLGALIYFRNDNIQIKVIDEKRWYEIDDIQDYERANLSEL